MKKLETEIEVVQGAPLSMLATVFRKILVNEGMLSRTALAKRISDYYFNLTKSNPYAIQGDNNRANNLINAIMGENPTWKSLVNGLRALGKKRVVMTWEVTDANDEVNVYKFRMDIQGKRVDEDE